MRGMTIHKIVSKHFLREKNLVQNSPLGIGRSIIGSNGDTIRKRGKIMKKEPERKKSEI